MNGIWSRKAPGPAKMSKHERQFYEVHLAQTGHRLIAQPERRIVRPSIGFEDFFPTYGYAYRVDFKCEECGVYFEVASSDGSYHSHVRDILGWRKLYKEPIYIVRPDGRRYYHRLKNRSSYNKPTLSERKLPGLFESTA